MEQPAPLLDAAMRASLAMLAVGAGVGFLVGLTIMLLAEFVLR